MTTIRGLRYVNAWVSHKKISMALIITIQVLYDISKEILKVDLHFVVMATIT